LYGTRITSSITNIVTGFPRVTVKAGDSSNELYGHFKSPVFGTNPYTGLEGAVLKQKYQLQYRPLFVQKNKKGSNPLDRGLAGLALEAVPRAAPLRLISVLTDLNAVLETSPCAAFSGKLGAGVRHREWEFFCRRTNPRRVGEINRASSQAPSAARISHQPNP
jgi:hypothetical protein